MADTHPKKEMRRFFAQLPDTSRFISACTSAMRAATAFLSVSSFRMPCASRSIASSTALLPSASGAVASALLRVVGTRRQAQASQSRRVLRRRSRPRRAHAHAARTVRAAAPRQPRCRARRRRAAPCALRRPPQRSPAPQPCCSAAAGASAHNATSSAGAESAQGGRQGRVRVAQSCTGRAERCCAGDACPGAAPRGTWERAPAAGRRPAWRPAAEPPARHTWMRPWHAGCVSRSRSRFVSAAAAVVLQDGSKRVHKLRPRVWEREYETWLPHYSAGVGPRAAGGSRLIPRRAPQPWGPRRTWCWASMRGLWWCVHGAASRAGVRACAGPGAAPSWPLRSALLLCPPRAAAGSTGRVERRRGSAALSFRGGSAGRGAAAPQGRAFSLPDGASCLQIGSFAAFLFGFGALGRLRDGWQRAAHARPRKLQCSLIVPQIAPKLS